MIRSLLLTLTLFSFLISPLVAEVRLPKILGSHMVLQRNSDVRIWGWADAGEQVTVKPDWQDSVKTTTSNEGTWEVRLKTGHSGKAHSLTIQAKNEIALTDILFGEVWIASGQSNMEMPLTKVSGAYTGIKNYEQEIAEANLPDIRLFQAGNFSSQDPLEDVEPGIVMYGVPIAKCQWQACSPESVPTFSSTAYFFAREVHQSLNVPVGIIDASWGGTAAEAWTPKAGLEKLKLEQDLKQAAEAPQEPDKKIPTRLYNGMIHPLRKFQIRGAIWYQGESNTGRAAQYRDLFSTMITEWRTAFGYDFPFYFVQTSPFNYKNVNAAYLREAQLQTLSLPKTGMAVTMDIGNLTDIHPKNKQEVGRRLALWAFTEIYGQPIICSGPLYKSAHFEGAEVRLHFEHTGSGLATNDGKAPSHFSVAGEDQVFHPATATLEGNEVIVFSEKVAAPKAVRYGFTSNATPNLINKEGLPASSFRTDKW